MLLLAIPTKCSTAADVSRKAEMKRDQQAAAARVLMMATSVGLKIFPGPQPATDATVARGRTSSARHGRRAIRFSPLTASDGFLIRLLVAAAVALGLGPRTVHAQCNSHSNCPASTYCDGHECYDCEWVQRVGHCDAFDGSCTRCEAADAQECVEPTTEVECQAAALAAGLSLGGGGYEFAGAYTRGGCYAYATGVYGGAAFWSTGSAELDASQYRVCMAAEAAAEEAAALAAATSCSTCTDLGWGLTGDSDTVCAESDDGFACSTGIVFSEAEETCMLAGARLCNADELIAKEGQGTGCGHDDRLVWSSSVSAFTGGATTCSPVERLAVMGNYRGRDGDMSCVDMHEATPVLRCCADTVCQSTAVATPDIEPQQPCPNGQELDGDGLCHSRQWQTYQSVGAHHTTQLHPGGWLQVVHGCVDEGRLISMLHNRTVAECMTACLQNVACVAVEHGKEPDATAVQDRRDELAGQSPSELYILARSGGASVDQLAATQDADDPKAALITLLVSLEAAHIAVPRDSCRLMSGTDDLAACDGRRTVVDLYIPCRGPVGSDVSSSRRPAHFPTADAYCEDVSGGCAPGLYRPPGKALCDSCPVNWFTTNELDVRVQWGSTKCVRCPEGKYNNLISDRCDTCHPGRYGSKSVSMLDSLSVLTCPDPLDEECGAVGMVSCGGTRCVPGGALDCAVCEAGHYTKRSSDRDGVGVVIGASQCEQCPAGMHNQQGDAECEVCPSGQYSADPGTVACTRCPAGHYTSAEPAPELWMHPCPGLESITGTFSTTDTRGHTYTVDLTEWTVIQDGQISLGTLANIDYDSSSATFSEGDGNCGPGSAGRATTINFAYAESAILEVSEPETCVYTLDILLPECGLPTHSNYTGRGATLCTQCPAGKFNEQSNAACEDCDRGKYSSEVGAATVLVCKLCTPGLAPISRPVEPFVTKMMMGDRWRTLSVRIDGGKSNGVLLMDVDGHGWAPVCNDGFNFDEAAAVCRTLGFETSTTEIFPTTDSTDLTDSQTQQMFAVDDLDCPSGWALLSDCSTSRLPYQHNCRSDETVTIDCDGPEAEIELPRTLENGGQNVDGYPSVSLLMGTIERTVAVRLSAWSHGVLELNVQGHGWGPVCDDGFGEEEAKAVCVHLFASSLSDDSPVKYYSTFQSDDWFVADNIDCGGSNSGLSGCSSAALYEHNCGMHEVVGIECFPSAISDNSEITRYLTIGANGSNACPDGAQSIATAEACEAAATQLGYGWNGVSNRSNQLTGCWRGITGNVADWNPLDGVDVSGRARICITQDLRHAESDRRITGADNGAVHVLPQQPRSRYANVHTAHSVKFGESQSQVKLRMQGSSHRGFLEMNINDQGWGFVCDDGLGIGEALTFCRALGFARWPEDVWHRVPSDHLFIDRQIGTQSISGPARFAADEFVCKGKVTAGTSAFVDTTEVSAAERFWFDNVGSSLNHCSSSQAPYDHDCSDNEIVFLDCGYSRVQDRTAVETTTQRGVAGATHCGSCPAGKQVGLNSTCVACAPGQYSATAGSCLPCPSDMVSNSADGMWQFSPQHNRAVPLSTMVETPSTHSSASNLRMSMGVENDDALVERNVSVRLKTAAGIEHRGQLQVAIDGGQWGNVCDDHFDDDAAYAFCRSLGYNGNEDTTEHFTVSDMTDTWEHEEPLDASQFLLQTTFCCEQPFAADDIKCPRGALGIHDCLSYNQPYESDCDASEIVLLDCGHDSQRWEVDAPRTRCTDCIDGASVQDTCSETPHGCDATTSCEWQWSMRWGWIVVLVLASIAVVGVQICYVNGEGGEDPDRLPRLKGLSKFWCCPLFVTFTCCICVTKRQRRRTHLDIAAEVLAVYYRPAPPFDAIGDRSLATITEKHPVRSICRKNIYKLQWRGEDMQEYNPDDRWYSIDDFTDPSTHSRFEDPSAGTSNCKSVLTCVVWSLCCPCLMLRCRKAITKTTKEQALQAREELVANELAAQKAREQQALEEGVAAAAVAAREALSIAQENDVQNFMRAQHNVDMETARHYLRATDQIIVNVREIAGVVLIVKTSWKDTLNALKETISSQTGLASAYQRLILDGDLLDDEYQTLGQLGIPHNAALNLIPHDQAQQSHPSSAVELEDTTLREVLGTTGAWDLQQAMDVYIFDLLQQQKEDEALEQFRDGIRARVRVRRIQTRRTSLGTNCTPPTYSSVAAGEGPSTRGKDEGRRLGHGSGTWKVGDVLSRTSQTVVSVYFDADGDSDQHFGLLPADHGGDGDYSDLRTYGWTIKQGRAAAIIASSGTEVTARTEDWRLQGNTITMAYGPNERRLCFWAGGVQAITREPDTVITGLPEQRMHAAVGLYSNSATVLAFQVRERCGDLANANEKVAQYWLARSGWDVSLAVKQCIDEHERQHVEEEQLQEERRRAAEAEARQRAEDERRAAEAAAQAAAEAAEQERRAAEAAAQAAAEAAERMAVLRRTKSVPLEQKVQPALKSNTVRMMQKLDLSSLRRSLQDEKMSALLRRTRSCSLDEDALDSVHDTENPKSSLIQMLLEWYSTHGPPDDLLNPPEPQLRGLVQCEVCFGAGVMGSGVTVHPFPSNYSIGFENNSVPPTICSIEDKSPLRDSLNIGDTVLRVSYWKKEARDPRSTVMLLPPQPLTTGAPAVDCAQMSGSDLTSILQVFEGGVAEERVLTIRCTQPGTDGEQATVEAIKETATATDSCRGPDETLLPVMHGSKVTEVVKMTCIIRWATAGESEFLTKAAMERLGQAMAEAANAPTEEVVHEIPDDEWAAVCKSISADPDKGMDAQQCLVALEQIYVESAAPQDVSLDHVVSQLAATVEQAIEKPLLSLHAGELDHSVSIRHSNSGSSHAIRDEPVPCFVCLGTGSVSKHLGSFNAPDEEQDDAFPCEVCFGESKFGTSTDCMHFYCGDCSKPESIHHPSFSQLLLS